MEINEQTVNAAVTAMRDIDNTAIKHQLSKLENTRYACVMCKSLLPSQSFGGVLERHIKNKFNFKKKINEVSGDLLYVGRTAELCWNASKICRDKYNIEHNVTIEIKVSLGGTDNSFNFVQLRPDHAVDYYLLLTYCLLEDKVTWLLIPSNEMYQLIVKYPSYAHKTIKELGIITADNIHNGNEYALRPNPIGLKKCGGFIKNRELWEEMKEFEVKEEDIIGILDTKWQEKQ